MQVLFVALFRTVLCHSSCYVVGMLRIDIYIYIHTYKQLVQGESVSALHISQRHWRRVHCHHHRRVCQHVCVKNCTCIGLRVFTYSWQFSLTRYLRRNIMYRIYCADNHRRRELATRLSCCRWTRLQLPPSPTQLFYPTVFSYKNVPVTCLSIYERYATREKKIRWKMPGDGKNDQRWCASKGLSPRVLETGAVWCKCGVWWARRAPLISGTVVLSALDPWSVRLVSHRVSYARSDSATCLEQYDGQRPKLPLQDYGKKKKKEHWCVCLLARKLLCVNFSPRRIFFFFLPLKPSYC